MNLIRLKNFESVLEAEMVGDLLKQEGIHFVLQKDGIPGVTGMTQGANLFVQEKDLERARALAL